MSRVSRSSLAKHKYCTPRAVRSLRRAVTHVLGAQPMYTLADAQMHIKACSRVACCFRVARDVSTARSPVAAVQPFPTRTRAADSWHWRQGRGHTVCPNRLRTSGGLNTHSLPVPLFDNAWACFDPCAPPAARRPLPIVDCARQPAAAAPERDGLRRPTHPTLTRTTRAGCARPARSPCCPGRLSCRRRSPRPMPRARRQTSPPPAGL